MKKTLLLLLFITGAMSAQIVNIPDTILKDELINGGDNSGYKDINGNFINDVDANNDGEVQVSEAQNISSITFYYCPFSDTAGLEAFTNLKDLTMPSNFEGSVLDLTGLASLEDLYAGMAYAWVHLNVSGLVNLKRIVATNTSLAGTLDVSGLTALEYLNIGDSYDEGAVNPLILSGNPNLKKIICMGNSISALNLSACPNLEYLSCSLNNLSALDISGCANLKTLDCSLNNITELHFEGLADLEEVYCSSNQISNVLDFSAANGLTKLDCGDNYYIPGIIINDKPLLNTLDVSYNEDIEELVLGSMPVLTSLRVSDTNIQIIDAGQCPELTKLWAHKTPSLAYINLKNGNPVMQTFAIFTDYFDEISNDVYICTDEGEEEMVLDHYADFDMEGYVHISTYCSFTPGGNYNTIAGNVYLDCGLATPLEGFVSVSINDGTETGTAFTNNAEYSLYTQEGAFTLTPQISSNLFTVSPATAAVNFADNGNNTFTQDFCLLANGVHPDVDVLIVPVVAAQPGFDAVYKIIYTNKGNQTLSGDVTFAYNDDVLDYVSANPVEASSATGTLMWNYSSLLPFESREITVTLNVNGPMETPAVNIDDELEFSATITPSTADETPWDNTFNFNQVVIGAYDPNDITCLEGETISPNYIGQYLHYNINFENTGTAPATFITIKGVIDETQFDISTLQLIYASHDVEARITGNKVEFYFDAINLAANGGKGNVVFKIKTLDTVEVNSSVTQQAEIFFDYNWPIVTNEATTTFSVLSAGVFDKDNTIAVSPNPATDRVNITSANELKQVELYDVQGRLLQSVPVNGTKTALDIANRAAGIYFVKIFTEKGAGIEKVIKL